MAYDACTPVSSLLSQHCSAKRWNHLQWMLLSNTNTTLVRFFWFAFCVLFSEYLLFTFFLWLAQRQLTGWKKLKGSGLLWRLVPEFSLRSVTVSLCARAECLQMSFQLTNTSQMYKQAKQRDRTWITPTRPLDIRGCLCCKRHHICRINKTQIAPLGLLLFCSCLAGLVSYCGFGHRHRCHLHRCLFESRKDSGLQGKVLTEKTCKCSEHACAVLSLPPFALYPERLTPFMTSHLESVFLKLAQV